MGKRGDGIIRELDYLNTCCNFNMITI